MAEITYDYFTMYETGGESFQMWQGRVGPYYLPNVSPEGVLSFTNNGSLPNPAPVNIRGPVGQGIQISGVAETYEELPDDANQGDVWLVGTDYPLEGWVWLGAWMNIGPQGPQGQQGAVFTPEVDEEGNISWTNDGGLPNPETVNIMGPQGEQGEQGETGPAGTGVADGGTTGQVLKKASDDDYDTSWQPLNAGEILYADDGGYASGTVGSEILAAKGDIEDLQQDIAGLDAGDVSYDSSLTYAAGTVGKELGDQKNTLNQLVRPNLLDNWYFNYGKTIDSSNPYSSDGTFPVNQRGQQGYLNVSYAYAIDRWVLNGSLYINENNTVGFTGINGPVLFQRFEKPQKLTGKTVTISALGWVDTANSFYLTLLINDSWALNVPFKTTNDCVYAVIDLAPYGEISKFEFNVVNWVSNANCYLYAAKVEIGSGQTLAHWNGTKWVLNEIPDYSEQLYRCCASTADSNDSYANKPYNKQGVFNISVWSGYTVSIYNSFITGNVQNTNCTITGFGIVAGWALIAYVYSAYLPKTEVLAPGIMYEGNDALECLIRITTQGELSVFVSNQLATQFAGKSPIVVVNTSYLIA